MGFTLEEIRSLFSTGDEGQCRHVKKLLEEKLEELEQKSKKIREFKIVLKRHLNNCSEELNSKGSDAVCPVLVTSE